ncbi:hypothetical protein chiPu_0010875 [Chiloscyllium punctatum]|uniref:Uncharacterized protein n=1 Tax=Chiloscyllium punctatum TaxID=137246 RepID=A0A401SPT6_CHIPU|nr:hypothetical protein [Chiloscyllium punctatum]
MNDVTVLVWLCDARRWANRGLERELRGGPSTITERAGWWESLPTHAPAISCFSQEGDRLLDSDLYSFTAPLTFSSSSSSNNPDWPRTGAETKGGRGTCSQAETHTHTNRRQSSVKAIF